MKNNLFKTWIKVSSLDDIHGETRGIEISSDFYFRSFKSFEDLKVLIPDESFGSLKILTPKEIFTETKLLTPEQQTLLKDKRREVDFKMLKNHYFDLNVVDGSTTTFEITEGNFSKRIQEGNFEWENTEYEPLGRLIDYIYSFNYTEN